MLGEKLRKLVFKHIYDMKNSSVRERRGPLPIFQSRRKSGSRRGSFLGFVHDITESGLTVLSHTQTQTQRPC